MKELAISARRRRIGLIDALDPCKKRLFPKSQILLVLTLLLTVTGCDKQFPSKNNVDDFFVRYGSERAIDRRAEMWKRFLRQLSDPRSVSDDETVKYAMTKARTLYVQKKDEAILAAMDEVPIDGGFANFVCEFYRSVRYETEFVERYRSNLDAQEAIERCIGLSFSEAEIKEILAR